ncbi:LysE family translocator [Pontixanthobacter aestiaquae]|uniref:LysE family transporter n=1 Tax=Pontixanthobacter aestiaquae TaxID=1509367 RepID=A0A844Z363_9SPHN|nr:LysE family translocator [Pontixanthobacter aestiaquae]MDN3646641.1 LysE family translocator [Pontixanthobacter aestiaquae]MXO82375.1 LysE family transporter [Pontixanthobacter aestiaquae]
MDVSTFALFALTTLVVVATPGPAAITITAQGASDGFLRAQYGIIGIASANAIYFVLSATGIAALIIASNLLFSVIKWVGVAYLAYIGITAILSKTGGLTVEPGPPAQSKALYTKGFIVEFANPKALLYFAAILPQFLNVSAPIGPQILTMGVTTLILDITIYSVYAGLGQTIARSGVKPWVLRGFNGIAGGALLFAAFKMARVTN